jgi:hypothetical protein
MDFDQPFYICTQRSIAFPSRCQIELTPTANERDEVAYNHSSKIRQRCQDTPLALQDLRHGIANALSDTLAKRNLDWYVLVQLLDERPTVVQQLMRGEIDELTTETLIVYLEKLHNPPLEHEGYGRRSHAAR